MALSDPGRHPDRERTSAQQPQAKRVKVAASNRHVRDDRLRFARQRRRPSTDICRDGPPAKGTTLANALEETSGIPSSRCSQSLVPAVRCSAVWYFSLGRERALPRHVLRRRPNRRDRRQESCASSAQRRRAGPASMPARRSGAPSSAGAFRSPLVAVLSPSFKERLAAKLDA